MRITFHNPSALVAIAKRVLLAFFLGLLFTASLASLAAGGAFVDKTLVTIPGGDNRSYAIALQSDGKILAAGYAYYGTKQFTLTRYNANGTVDTAFGDAGTRLEWLGPGNAEAHGVAQLGDGTIIVGGFAVSDMSRFGIARFHADGTLDTSYGGGGAVTTIGTGSAAYAMAVQGDGKVLLGGWSMVSGKKVFTLARYIASMPALDTTFGTNGVVSAAAGTTDMQINALTIQGDGKIVAVGGDGAQVTVRRYNSDGSADPSFGTSGVATFSVLARAHAVTLLSNGQILVAGDNANAGSAFMVLRLNSNGAQDGTFGAGGIASVNAGALGAQANAIRVQSDGKIVVAGTGAIPAGRAVAVARFNANGSVDTGFGSSGLATRQFNASTDEGNALAILGTGQLVVAGTSGSASAPDELLAAFASTGALDTSFGSGGSTIVDIGSKQSGGYASALQLDGKLVVAGYERPTPTAPSVTTTAVARFNVDGTLDATFGTGGIATVAGDVAHAVAVQSDGKIIVAGRAAGNFNGNPATHLAIVRLNSNGSVDSGFSANIAPNGSTEEANAIAIQSDGRIVIGGVARPGTFLDAMFLRLNSDGSLDTTFGGTGKVTISMSSGNDALNAIAIQGDNKIVGAGWGDVSGSQDSIMLTRVGSNGSVDAAFGTSGVVTTSVGATNSIANAIALQGDGKIVVGGQWFSPSSTTDDFIVARYSSAGALDTSFGTNGVTTTDMGNHNRIFGLVIKPTTGKIVAAGEWGAAFGLAQYLPSGTLDTSFGTNGTVRTEVNAGNDIAYSIVLRSDGKLWVAGDASGLIGAVRYTADGSAVTPTVSLSSSANPSGSSQNVTFTAAVSGSAGTATGTANFKDGGTSISGCAAVALSSGSAACTTSALSIGTHSITAVYSGDSNYSTATSNTVSQSVSTTVSTFSLSVSVSGSGTITSTPAGIQCPPTCTTTFASGQVVTLSAAAPTGSSFFGFSGDCTGTSCSITMNATKVVYAGFYTGNITVRYRLYSGGTFEHLYTTNLYEYQYLSNQVDPSCCGWSAEGPIYNLFRDAGTFGGVQTVPYMRLYNPNSFQHHWTTDLNEYNTLATLGWQQEGIDGYILPSSVQGTLPLYRLYLNAQGGLHLWTTDANEVNSLTTNAGWTYEGISGYVLPLQ